MLDGILLALDPVNLVFVIVGVVLGIVVGAIPGLTATLGIALLVPVTFVMEPATGMIMLVGIYAGSIYGGSITAILINVPGTPASVPTMWDGYALTRQAHARTALGTAAFASAIGGLASGVVLFALSPVVADLALKLGPAEYTMVIVFGLVAVTVMLGRRLVAATIGMLVGMTLALVGYDPSSGQPRLMFDTYQLSGGLDVVAVLVGIFCLTEAVRVAVRAIRQERGIGQLEMDRSRALPPAGILRSNIWNLGRSATIGSATGVMPAVGPETAPFITYALAKRASKQPQQFGKGSYAGIMASESANNSVVGGSLVPLLTLGIPGSGAAAVFAGALILQGLRPGPTLFLEQQPLMYALFTGFILANVLMLVVGLTFVRKFAIMLTIPLSIMATIIALASVVGAYALTNNTFEVIVMFGAALLAAALSFIRIPVAPIVLGLILGPMLETYLVRALNMSNGSPSIFVNSPFVWVVTALTIALVVWSRRARLGDRSEPADERTQPV